MAVVCEDLAGYGVVLAPPSTEKYFQMLEDIERRLHSRPKGSPPLDDGALSRIAEHDTRGSAILLNQAQESIVALAYIWSFRMQNGRIGDDRFFPGTNASSLLPYMLSPQIGKLHAYWHTIFPGSKRLLTSDGNQYGDNTDVRAPEEDELWHGGFFSAGGGSRTGIREPVKLTIDGVFFADGGFAGPNQLGSWEHTGAAQEAYQACAKLAIGAPARDFFDQVKDLTGCKDATSPPPPPSWPPDPTAIRKEELWQVGMSVLWMRKEMGDEKAMASIAAWARVPAPKLHKL
jgi:hypothetical protein